MNGANTFVALGAHEMPGKINGNSALLTAGIPREHCRDPFKSHARET